MPNLSNQGDLYVYSIIFRFSLCIPTDPSKSMIMKRENFQRTGRRRGIFKLRSFIRYKSSKRLSSGFHSDSLIRRYTTGRNGGKKRGTVPPNEYRYMDIN